MGRSFSPGSEAAINARNRRIQTDEAIEKRNRRIENILGIVAVAVSIVFVAASYYNNIEADKQIDVLAEDIKLRAQELDQAKNQEGVSEEGLVVEEEATVNSAAEAGKAVCDMQNALAKMTRDARKAGQNMASKDYQQTLVDFRNYFVDIKDPEIKRCWCEYGQWTFDSTFAYEGVSMPIVWRCYDGEDLLAIVTANYNGSTSKFSDAELFRTVDFVYIQDSDPLIINPVVTTIPDEEEEVSSSFSFRTTARSDVPVEERVTTTYITDADGNIIVTDPDADTTRPADITSSDTTTTSISGTTTSTTTGVSGSSPSNGSSPAVTTVTTSRTASTIQYIEPEEQWYYGWSSTYQCWGYFDQDGRFLTEDEYQEEFGW